jgi:hypothetical protein
VGGTPYWLIVPTVVGWLAYRHATSPTASDRSKKVVVGLTIGGFLLALAWPLATIPVVLLFVGVGAYVLIHREISDHIEKIEKTESDRLPRE